MPIPIPYRVAPWPGQAQHPDVAFRAMALHPDPDGPQPLLLAEGQGISVELEALAQYRITLVVEAAALGPDPVLEVTVGLLQYRIRFGGYARLAAAYRLHAASAQLKPLWGGGYAPELPCLPLEAEFVGGSWPAGALPLTAALAWSQARLEGAELIVERLP